MALDFFAEQHARIDLGSTLPRIRCPTLVLAGEEDPITPLDDAYDIARAIDSQFLTFRSFPGCGHGVFPDNPLDTIAAIREFVFRIG
jgi:proline iminopeptidase